MRRRWWWLLLASVEAHVKGDRDRHITYITVENAATMARQPRRNSIGRITSVDRQHGFSKRGQLYRQSIEHLLIARMARTAKATEIPCGSEWRTAAASTISAEFRQIIRPVSECLHCKDHARTESINGS